MRFLTKGSLRFPKRKRTMHKGDNGRVLIIGGSEEYVGCLALAGLAALRAGVDIVTISAPSRVAWAINCYTPDLITIKVNCKYFSNRHSRRLANLSKWFDAVLIGNGLGIRRETKNFVRSITKQIVKPLVIDADAIKALKIQEVNNAIFTPHKTEFEILLENSNIPENDIRKVIGNNVIIVKGAIDNIITKDNVLYNKTGNAGMTKAGTGDVLAGLCAGFLAQTNDLLQSAINATYINGAVGDLLKKRKGYAYIASDMVKDIKDVNRLRLSLR